MLFQALDDKRECLGIYSAGELHYNQPPENLTKTWGYSPVCSGRDIEYAQIYSGGKSLSEVCPDDLRGDFSIVSSKMMAFLKSFKKSKIDLSENCFYDMVPQRFLLDFYSVKDAVCEHVFDSLEKPVNHDFLAKISEMVYDISCQDFPLNKSALDRFAANPAALNLRKKIGPLNSVRYNMFGTVTGRLTTFKNSFPILTLDKKFRNVVEPVNDLLVEIDYNAAELRTLLGLSGITQPSGDIHTWNMQNIFPEAQSRDEAKKSIFSWLYNPESSNRMAEKYYLREDLIKKYHDGQVVTTPMGRKVESTRRTALNYLIQSTSSDIFLNSAYGVWSGMKDMKSSVRFLVHDSLLLDVCESEMAEVTRLIDVFSKTPLGEYAVGVSIGKSYGNMRKIK